MLEANGDVSWPNAALWARNVLSFRWSLHHVRYACNWFDICVLVSFLLSSELFAVVSIFTPNRHIDCWFISVCQWSNTSYFLDVMNFFANSFHTEKNVHKNGIFHYRSGSTNSHIHARYIEICRVHVCVRLSMRTCVFPCLLYKINSAFTCVLCAKWVANCSDWFHSIQFM